MRAVLAIFTALLLEGLCVASSSSFGVWDDLRLSHVIVPVPRGMQEGASSKAAPSCHSPRPLKDISRCAKTADARAVSHGERRQDGGQGVPLCREHQRDHEGQVQRLEPPRLVKGQRLLYWAVSDVDGPFAELSAPSGHCVVGAVPVRRVCRSVLARAQPVTAVEAADGGFAGGQREGCAWGEISPCFHDFGG